ncbi:YdcF family protein [Aggregatilineales bacterium SYSU G02658]
MDHKRPPQRISAKWLLRGALAAAAGWLLIQLGLMLTVHVYGVTRPPVAQADALIVLGAGVNHDGRAGPALTRRATLGAELFAQGVAPRVVCSGGQPYNRPTTEASACREVLLRLSVPDAAILQEDRSHSTEENALRTAQLLPNARVVVVSDSYHLLRAGILFRSYGFDVQLAGVAPERSVSRQSYFNSVTREALALQWQFIKDLLGLPFTRVTGF